MKGIKSERTQAAVNRALEKLQRAAGGSENTFPCILEAVKAYATVGEICRTLKKEFGAYKEVAVL